MKNTHLTERKNRFVVNYALDKSLGPGTNFLFSESNRHFPAIELSAGGFTDQWCPFFVVVPFLKRLSVLILLFHEYKGKEADSKSVGKSWQEKMFKIAPLDAKHLQRSRSFLRPRVSKMQRQLFIWTSHSELASRKGWFLSATPGLAGLTQTPPNLQSVDLTQRQVLFKKALHGKLHYVGQESFWCKQIKSDSPCVRLMP